MRADFPTSNRPSGSTQTSNGGTTPINAPGSTNVTLNVNGLLDSSTPTAIDIGHGTEINVAGGGTITSLPSGVTMNLPALLPDVNDPGVTDEATFQAAVDPFVGVDQTATTFSDPLIRLRDATSADFTTDSTAMSDATTAAKARLADYPLARINDVNIASPSSPPPVFELRTVLGTTSLNDINNLGLIASVNSEAILGTAGSANRINIDGGLLGSNANGSPVYRGANGSVVEFLMSNGAQVTTLANNADAIVLGANSNSGVQIVDSELFTLGNFADAISGEFSDSTFTLKIDGRGTRYPALGTFGDGSAGVRLAGTGNSTATFNIQGAVSNAFSDGLQTTGDNAPLF